MSFERVLEEGQALGPLVCDLSGAEATFVKMFVGNSLFSMHAAPKEDG